MSAPPYPKIETRFVRREDHTLDLEKLRRPEFGLVEHWLATEKIDGTNIRVSLELNEGFHPADGSPNAWAVRFYGRTNNAQMPDFIQQYLEATFKLEDMKRLWQCRRNCEICLGTKQADPLVDPPKALKPCPNFEPYPITLYGEAYGARIQKGGGDYRKGGDISFRLFDVLVGERSWLDWGNVVNVADALGIKTVPLLDEAFDWSHIVMVVRNGFRSVVAEEEGRPRLAEGIVARTAPYLFDGQGRRLVWKVKTKDF